MQYARGKIGVYTEVAFYTFNTFNTFNTPVNMLKMIKMIKLIKKVGKILDKGGVVVIYLHQQKFNLLTYKTY